MLKRAVQRSVIPAYAGTKVGNPGYGIGAITKVDSRVRGNDAVKGITTDFYYRSTTCL